MGLLSFISKPLAKIFARRIVSNNRDGVMLQKAVFKKLIERGRPTQFGKDHQFEFIQTYADFKTKVPVRDYEELKPYIDKIISGEENILWPGKPAYLSKTSGTTSGIKYIPITKESMPNHLDSTRNAMFCYIAETGKADFLKGKLIFISGSPKLVVQNGISVGRLSGIVNHHVPDYLRRNQLPSWETNCIDDFDEKIERIVDETLHQNMTMISGIPPWVQMYFDKIETRTGKKIKDVFPDFCLFIYGGVNFEPYRNRFESSIGKSIDSIELYPASEGFIAFQDSQKRDDLLLNVNSGIFFEFIPAADFFKPDAARLSLGEVKTGVNYALAISTNAGLWAYSLGDTIKFTCLAPYRIVVTGRIKHFISAFGEHVIAEEVEYAMTKACLLHRAHAVEFTVAPQVNPPAGRKPYHEWLIEFDQLPDDLTAFTQTLNRELMNQNIYYRDLLDGTVLEPLHVTPLMRDAFVNYMRSKGKLGGQNKVPRLANNRDMADELLQYNSQLISE